MEHNTSPTDDIEIIEVKNRPTEPTEKHLLNLFTKWSSALDPNQPILLNDYFYQDPLIKKMRPFPAYTYTLGLELALTQSIETFEPVSTTSNSHNFSDSNLQLNIDNKTEFLNHLNKYKQLIKQRNPPLKMHKCNYCEFRADNLVSLDHHLTQPHFYATIYQCNFCKEFRSNSKEEYKTHLQVKHKRTCHFERPLSQYMCSKCNYESGYDYVKLVKHETSMCPFRDADSNNNLLENFLAPSRIDLLEHEFLFQEKPVDQTHCSSLVLDAISQAGPTNSWLHDTYQNLNFKIIESLINDERVTRSTVSVTKPNFTTYNGFRSLPLVSSINLNKPEVVSQPSKDLIISIQASNHYKCHLCSMKFIGEFRLKSLIDHLRLNHQIVDKLLTKTIQDYILPQIKSNKSSIQIPTGPSTVRLATPTPVAVTQLPANPNLIRILNTNQKQIDVSLYNCEKEQISTILRNYKSELVQVYSNLNEDLVNRLVELKLISGKCFKCGFKNIESNLLLHLSSVHDLDVSGLVNGLNCLFCGQLLPNRDKLVVHQLNMHKSISFSSTNKIYTLSTSIESTQHESKMNGILTSGTTRTSQSNDIMPKKADESNSDCILIDLTQMSSNEKVSANNSDSNKKYAEFLSTTTKKLAVEISKPDNNNSNIQLEKIDELEPVFDPQHEKLVKNLDNLYNNSSKIEENKEAKKKKHEINAESDETKEIKKKKIEYNCAKCATQYTDFKAYKKHLVEAHNLLMKENKSSDLLNLKILPSTSSTSPPESLPVAGEEEKPKLKCFFCSARFSAESKYQLHLESNHMKQAVVKVYKVNPKSITIISRNNKKPTSSPSLISSDSIRKSNRLSIKKESN